MAISRNRQRFLKEVLWGHMRSGVGGWDSQVWKHTMRGEEASVDELTLGWRDWQGWLFHQPVEWSETRWRQLKLIWKDLWIYCFARAHFTSTLFLFAVHANIEGLHSQTATLRKAANILYQQEEDSFLAESLASPVKSSPGPTRRCKQIASVDIWRRSSSYKNLKNNWMSGTKHARSLGRKGFNMTSLLWNFWLLTGGNPSGHGKHAEAYGSKRSTFKTIFKRSSRESLLLEELQVCSADLNKTALQPCQWHAVPWGHVNSFCPAILS